MSQPTISQSLPAASTAQRFGHLAAIVGGVLWALVAPVFVLWDQAELSAQTLILVAAFLVGFVSLLLLILGLAPLYALGVRRLGRLGMTGVLISAIALGLMAVGNGIELVTLAAQGRESDIGHTVFLVAFLILLVASILIGQVFVRPRWSLLSRVGGLVLVLSLPLGSLFLLLGNAISPTTDLGFWAALTVPYAIGRVLLAVSAPRS